ncbi:hypothetical protein NM208_g3219 [Fusarium decemcellulare]|uniref:Uncharacterized protein n=1 Tax=Fusarium decemcellulare TaxID=57161 RepID=A0ACC1SQF0_9HYPO|nr:hypothetical protein NM208_g3219 [Fusarium decemcellulare]
MEFVVIMLICQHAGKHRGVMAHLLEEIVAQGRILEFDIHDVTAWCSHVIFESLANPNLKLGSWFWDASFQNAIMARPYRYGQSALIAHELGMVGELAVYLRKPERYLYQLRCYYNILGTERPFMRGLVEQSMPLIEKPEERRMALLCLSGYAGILSQAILVAPVLEAFSVHPSYVKDSHEPYGTFWMPELLKLVWASVKDCYRHKEIEELIAEYEKDAEGSNFMEEARDIKARFDKLGWSKEPDLNSPEEEVEETPACVIL